MSAFDDFCEQLQVRLGLDSSYRETDIPSSVRRYTRALLRDYNFPKTVQKEVYTNLAAGQQSYTLPKGFKKELQVVFMQLDAAGQPSFSEPMLKREGFVLPHSDGQARHYWIEGETLWTDVTLGADTEGLSLVIVYQTLDVDVCIPWLLTDFEDILFSRSMMRLASELSKPELAQVWAAIWAEDRQGIAVFLNELEFDNLHMQMREPAPQRNLQRYPR